MGDVAAALDSVRPAAPDAAHAAAHDERRWVRDALDGDARAFRRIVEAHHRPLYLMAVRLLGHPEDARDVVQDSFAKAYVSLARYDGNHRLTTWLHRIALNGCRDFLKSAKRRERAAGDDPVLERADERPDPEEELERGRRAERLHAALAELRPSYREALVLKDLQGLSYRDMKAITGTPITALKIRVVRARKRLRAALEEAP